MKHRFKISFFLLLLSFSMIVLYAQNVNMQPGIINLTDESGFFYDQGGLANNYPASTVGSIQLTLSSSIQYNYGTILAPNWVTSSLQFNFTQFALGVGDTLFIYDGNSTAAPLIGAYNSVNSPGVIISTGTSLTFVFYSDGIPDLNGLNMGWTAFYGIYFHQPRPYNLDATTASVVEIMECNGKLYDSGGPTGNFANGENNTIVFTSNIGTHVKAELVSFNVGTNSILEIYDGNLVIDPTNARRIGYFKNGYAPPQTLISSGSSMSFKFVTQGTGPGFQFDLSCITEIFQQGPGESACPKIDLGPYVVNGTFIPQDTIVFDCTNPMILLYADLKAPGLPTADYILQSIPYDPPFPWYGNGLTYTGNVNDDVWFGNVNLPSNPLFSFTYYGVSYTSLTPGANGAVSFNPHTGPSGWVFTNTIPNVTSPTYAFDVTPGTNDHKNSIFGILQDTDPRYVTTNGSDIGGIWYGFQGEFPCRAFVMSFNRLPLYIGGAGGAPQSYQIVVYEGSNIIEVHVKNRNGNSTTNDGRSLLGILNSGGNQAVVPPGRNTGNWNASEESWRFIPISPVDNITAVWYKNSVTPANLITNNNLDEKILAVFPDETTTYIGKLEFPTPIGTSYILYDTIVVVVNKPAINATSSVPSVCPDEPVELTVNTVNPNEADQLASFRWYDGITLLGTDQTIEVSPNATTTYNVIISYTNNCENNDTISITVPELSKPVIIGDTSICSGERSTLSVTEAVGTYNWSTGATTSSIIVSPNETAEYTVDVTTPIGCVTKDSITVNVAVKPTAMFLPSPNHVYVENGEGPVNFINMSENGALYFWNFGDQYSLPIDNVSDLESPLHIYTRSGKYRASLTVESDQGCLDSTYQFVTVEVPYFYYAPNSFTPNGDGINDLFYTSGEGVDPDNFEMFLYNRMGNLIFKSTTPYDYWDGRTMDGSLAPAGVYVYLIITHDMEGNPKKYQGSVTLIR